MTPDRYEILTVADAVAEAVPEAEDYTTLYGNNDWEAVIVRYADEGMKIVGWDGGEPEDNSFYRAYSWVDNALQEAYDRGVEHGRAAEVAAWKSQAASGNPVP